MMTLGEKYRRAVGVLKEISLGRGPFKVDQMEFAWSVINAMKTEAQKALTEIGETEEDEAEQDALAAQGIADQEAEAKARAEYEHDEEERHHHMEDERYREQDEHEEAGA